VPWERWWWCRMRSSELQALLDESPLHRGLALKVTELTDSSLTLEGEAGEGHVNSTASGVVHGGALAVVLDAAATLVLVHVTGADWSTVDFRVDYLRPVVAGPLVVRAVPDHVGRRIGRASAVLASGGQGPTHARAVGTFVRSQPVPRPQPTEAKR
jgi:uncharacterized protein (TIGR00369 family)